MKQHTELGLDPNEPALPFCENCLEQTECYLQLYNYKTNMTVRFCSIACLSDHTTQAHIDTLMDEDCSQTEEEE